jgi:hypothetical protein
MTGPRFADCRCTHAKAEHDVEGFAPQCTHSGCTCLRYRPDVGSAGTQTTAAGASRTPSLSAPAAVPTRPAAANTATAIADRLQPDQPAPTLTADVLLERGRASELKPINRLTERIEALLEDLAERVAAEEAAAELKASIAKLEKQLAARKSQLHTLAKGKPAKPRTPPRSQRRPRLPGLRQGPRHPAGARRPPLTRARLPKGRVISWR